MLYGERLPQTLAESLHIRPFVVVSFFSLSKANVHLRIFLFSMTISI